MHVRTNRFRLGVVAAVVTLCLGQTADAQGLNPELGDVGHQNHDAHGGDGHGNSDHDGVVGTMGLGFMGVTGMTLGDSNLPVNVDAPVLGVRYWQSAGLAIEAGLGLGMTSTTIKNGAVESTVSARAVILHGAAPLALATHAHWAFEVIPELNLGFGSGSDDGSQNDLSGFMLQLGARAGAELHFGFIDVPNLTLQGTVGLHYTSESGSLKNTASMMTTEVSRTRIGTNLQSMFTANVALLYYVSL